MNIPLELVNVLNWGDDAPGEDKVPGKNKAGEATVDNYLSDMHPVCGHMVQFGLDYHNFMDNNDPAALLEFIEKYRNSSYWRLAQFANGLQMDIDAVRNTLLRPDISNGTVEGINNDIKRDKRVCCGKAKIDLLSAKMLLRQIGKGIRTIINGATGNRAAAGIT
ncbi:MAG: transposase [Oscillospiraceae bacterium]|nr:transposase [Oscillospiraceae bacterium]